MWKKASEWQYRKSVLCGSRKGCKGRIWNCGSRKTKTVKEMGKWKQEDNDGKTENMGGWKQEGQ